MCDSPRRCLPSSSRRPTSAFSTAVVDVSKLTAGSAAVHGWFGFMSPMVVDIMVFAVVLCDVCYELVAMKELKEDAPTEASGV